MKTKKYTLNGLPHSMDGTVEYSSKDDDFEMLLLEESNENKLIEISLKANGRKWSFHKNDPDPWPSNCHGHSDCYVLDAFTGKIYSINLGRKHAPAAKLNKKELSKLQKKLTSDGFLE